MNPGKRRPRAARAVLRPAEPIALRRGRPDPRPLRMARLAIAAAAVLATAAIVDGGGPPFAFRLGQRPTREVRVNVAQFQRRDLVETNKERQKAAEEVPPAMLNDPAPIRDLAGRLDDLVDAVAAADELVDLPAGLAAPWKLEGPTFDDLKVAADTPERRDALHRRIAEAFEPLVRDGVLGPNALPPTEQSSRFLEIRAEGVPGGQARVVSRDQVASERVRKPDGPVAAEFARVFGSPAFGAIVADKLAGTPTLSFQERATTQAREAAYSRVPESYQTYGRGDVLVEQGQEIGEDQLILLKLEHEAANAAQPIGDVARRAAGIVAIVAALYALIGYYIARHEKPIAASLPRIAVLCGLVVVALGVARLLALQPWDAELIPIALAAMTLAIAYNPHFALMVTFALCLLTSMSLGGGLGHFLVLMGGTAAGVLPLAEVRSRTKPIKVGAAAALGYAALTWATGLWQDQPVGLVLADSGWRAGWGLMTGFFLGGCLPFVERAFGIVTGISLLELGDVTHPLLQELVRRAPGTYNHSVAVGTIAEAAAERVGANGLLVRIGAYFHDIGKMLKPHYFVENQTGGANRHDSLAPAMSTLIIVGHVKDGVELARQHHLPEPIIDLIEQHHGTTLVEYFYHEAAKRSGCGPDAARALECSFRYPGPRPQSKEAGVLMLSDAVESAGRTLSEPTPGRIEGLVGELIDKRLRDGQLDECGLTLREIADVRESLVKSLIGIYHGRVKYPEQRTA